MMLLNLRSSVVACLCGVSLLFLASNASAQGTTHQGLENTGSVWADGEWVESLPAETGTRSYSPREVPRYETPGYEMPRYETPRYEASPHEASPYEASPYEASPYEASPYERSPQEVLTPYEPEASALPAFDSATAVSQDPALYGSPVEAQSEAQDTYYYARAAAPAARYSVVKNSDLFGVDEDKCCDEWSRFCRFKDLKYKCNCGGLKANKGHLGIGWLRSADAGEDCDYCQGGCCKKGRAAGAQRREIRRDVFSSAWSKATRKANDHCELGNCAKEEGCTTCR